MTELNSRLVAARAHTSEALARLNRLETILASNSADSASMDSLDASGSDVLNNPIMSSLRLQYHEYARREFEYSIKYGADHLAVVSLRTTMKGIRASILEEVRRLAEASRNDFETAKQRQQDIEKQLAPNRPCASWRPAPRDIAVSMRPSCSGTWGRFSRNHFPYRRHG